MRLPLHSCVFIAISLFSTLWAQAEVDFEKAAGNNIGRLESDDGDEEHVFNDQLGDLGATILKVRFDEPGEATMALYSKTGQLVRILGQVIPVEAREYRLRWDGMDLFGNIVPSGTELELKTFFNPGIKVTYEMAIRPPKVAPWPGQFDRENSGPRMGGWLGDHSTPHGATAIGDTVFLSYKLAEEGYNIVGVNAKGEMVWAHKLEGWGGASLLNSNGKSVAAINSRAKSIYRLEPELKWDERKGRWRVQQKRLLSGSGFQHLTAHEQDLLIIGENKAVTAPLPHPSAFEHHKIDFIKSLPQVLNATAPTDFHISPQQAFGELFTLGGNPQIGTKMIPHDGYAFVMVVLKEPANIGTVVLPKMQDGVKKLEIFTLKTGVTYNENMAPNAGSGPDDLMSLTLNAQGEEWVSFGSSTLPQHLNWVSPGKQVRTQAILIKAFHKQQPPANWTPKLSMARVLANPVRPATSHVPQVTTDTKMKNWRAGFLSKTGWQGTTEYPISDTYPMKVLQDYGKPITFNAIVALDAVNPTVFVDILEEGVSLENASEENWTEIGRFQKHYTKKLQFMTSSRHYFDRYLQLRAPVTTRAIRYRMREGYKRGKWGPGNEDPMFTEAEHVLPLMADLPGADTENELSTSKLYWVDFDSGELKKTWVRPEYAVSTFDFAPDGTLYAIADGQLSRVQWNRETGEFSFTPLSRETFEQTHSLFMDVSRDRIAISDSNEDVVRVFDRKGKPLFKIGANATRKPGKWDKNAVRRPRGVALPSNGDIWIAENAFAPKRISRFDRKGTFKEDFLGPTMYGGGGHLDEDGKRMFYRGMEFIYDFEKGTSELVGLYDRPYAVNTPDATAFTFGGIRYADSIYVKGNRYLHGPGIISRKLDSEPKAIPAVVYGLASDHKFLQHEIWRSHWATQNLKDKFFVWCDHNEDGAYQIEEVELAHISALPKGGGGGTAVGPGLSLWAEQSRWAPSRFTPKGVPIFETKDIIPFNYDALAPHYQRNYTLSGKTSAKPMYSGLRYISSDGYLAQEGQPFVVKPDGTLLGGPPPKPSEYIPEVSGQRVETAWSWAGGAMTDSDVGEIAIINSFKGAWHIWGVKHGVMLGRFFTKSEGKFNGMNPVRGTDVTKRYMGWEGWHADFVKTRDGRYLAQGGKSFHSINEVHGLDNYRTLRQSFTVGAKDVALAQKLRPALKARSKANEGHQMSVYINKLRFQNPFVLDGLIEDWGDPGQFVFMDEKERTTRFDLSYNEKGLLVAIDGRGTLAGEAPNWKAAISEGFAIDLQIRKPGRHLRNPNIFPGDTRIFVSKVKGKWQGVLYRPLTGKGPSSAPFNLPSPFLDLNAEEFRLLGQNEIGIHVRETSLGVDVLDIGGGSGGFDLGDLGGDLMLDSEKTGGETKMGEGQNWTAEFLLPWSLIGEGDGKRRFDIGIRENGKEGRWFYWNNAYPGPRNQIELYLHPNPRAWGTIDLTHRKKK